VNPGAYGAPTIESTLEPEAQIGRLPAPKPIFVRASTNYGYRGQQFERGRPLAGGRIELQSRSAGLLPRIKNRLHRLPAGFNTVGTLKNYVVANQAIIDQPSRSQSQVQP
jgi:hypothetical protein